MLYNVQTLWLSGTAWLHFNAEIERSLKTRCVVVVKRGWKSLKTYLHSFISVRNQIKGDFYHLKDCVLFLASSRAPVLAARNILGQSS